MSEIITQPPTDLAGMSTEQLREELTKQLRVTAQTLLRLAWIVRILEERGEDLSSLRNGLLPHLRRIAYGQLLPELVVRFAASRLVLQRVSLLSMPEQRNLAEGGMVTLVVRRDSNFDKRQADPGKLTGDQVWQVFGPDHIRTEQEQILYLEDRAGKPANTPPPRGKVRADSTRGGLLVNRSFVSQAEVLEGLARLRQEDGREEGANEQTAELDAQIVVNLTAREHRELKVKSARNDTTMAELVRNALRAAGLI